ncbi:MAG: hypothetical protein IJH91_05670 [Mogibacterium sp.]|nr:hypothetical protein [Mogibacterium sp.]
MSDRIREIARQMLGGFDLRYVIFLAVCCFVMVIEMTQYVTPLQRAKEQYLKEINEYPLDQFLMEEREEINEARAAYEEPINNARSFAELEEIKQDFVASLDSYPTRQDVIDEYVEAIQEPIADIYSKKDREKANKLVEQFKEDAQSADSREDLYNLYITLRSTITTKYKTKEQVQKEKDEVNYLIGTWQIPNSPEPSFRLYSGGGFEMTVEEDGKRGKVTGSWTLEGSKVYIRISENSIDSNFDAFTWVFDYNTVERTLEGTGDYFGWIYYRVS